MSAQSKVGRRTNASASIAAAMDQPRTRPAARVGSIRCAETIVFASAYAVVVGLNIGRSTRGAAMFGPDTVRPDEHAC